MAGRQKFQVFLLVFCLIACFPLAISTRTAPGSLQEALEPLIVQFWAATMVAGCTLALLGPRLNHDTTALIIEEIGLALAGVPSFVYAVILVWQAGWDAAAVAAGFIGGFSIAAIWRYVDIYRYLKELGKVVEKIEGQ